MQAELVLKVNYCTMVLLLNLQSQKRAWQFVSVFDLSSNNRVIALLTVYLLLAGCSGANLAERPVNNL
jgi:hypothetical protein